MVGSAVTTASAVGRTRGATKGTLEIIEYFGEDGAIAKVVDGAGFAEGDIVRLAQ